MSRTAEWKQTVMSSPVYRDVNPPQEDLDHMLHASIHGDPEKRQEVGEAWERGQDDRNRFDEALGAKGTDHPSSLDEYEKQPWHSQISGHAVDPNLPLYSGTSAKTNKIRPARGEAGHGGMSQYEGAGGGRGELSENYAWSHPSESLAWTFADSSADRTGERGRVYKVQHASDETHGGSRYEPFEVKSPTGFDVAESIDIKPGHQGTFPDLNWHQFSSDEMGKRLTNQSANHPRDAELERAAWKADLHETPTPKPSYSTEISEHGEPGLFPRKDVEHPMVSKPPMLGSKVTLDDHMKGWDKSDPKAASYNMNSAQARVNDINRYVQNQKAGEAKDLYHGTSPVAEGQHKYFVKPKGQ